MKESTVNKPVTVSVAIIVIVAVACFRVIASALTERTSDEISNHGDQYYYKRDVFVLVVF